MYDYLLMISEWINLRTCQMFVFTEQNNAGQKRIS
jgi:hypothetical protein